MYTIRSKVCDHLTSALICEPFPKMPQSLKHEKHVCKLYCYNFLSQKDKAPVHKVDKDKVYKVWCEPEEPEWPELISDLSLTEIWD